MPRVLHGVRGRDYAPEHGNRPLPNAEHIEHLPPLVLIKLPITLGIVLSITFARPWCRSRSTAVIRREIRQMLQDTVKVIRKIIDILNRNQEMDISILISAYLHGCRYLFQAVLGPECHRCQSKELALISHTIPWLNPKISSHEVSNRGLDEPVSALRVR